MRAVVFSVVCVVCVEGGGEVSGVQGSNLGDPGPRFLCPHNVISPLQFISAYCIISCNNFNMDVWDYCSLDFPTELLNY